MLLMLRLSILMLMAAVVVNAEALTKDEILKHIKNNIVKNHQVKINSIDVVGSKKVPALKGWSVYFVNMNLTYRGQKINAPETVFYKDGFLTGNLFDLKGTNYRAIIKPDVDDSYYDKSHLLYDGNKNSAHKIVLFSDPMCPFCREIVPGLLKAAREHPDKIALYYYHLPLKRLHPVSVALARIMRMVQEDGKIDLLDKFYTLKIDYKEKNMTKIANAVKKDIGYDVDMKRLKSKELDNEIKHDEDVATKLMVAGTPTIYIDGKLDTTREKYKQLIK